MISYHKTTKKASPLSLLANPLLQRFNLHTHKLFSILHPSCLLHLLPFTPRDRSSLGLQSLYSRLQEVVGFRRKQQLKPARARGFTIVELLIVIVVIGILAAISIVAYNGISESARISSMKSDLASLNKAILLYHAENGSYPVTPVTATSCVSNWCGFDQATGDNFIPGLVPKYIDKTPQLPTSNANQDTYVYRSLNGTDYKLIRLKSSGLSEAELAATKDLRTTDCGSGHNTNRWGYWSSNTSKCW